MNSVLDLFMGDPVYDDQKNIIRRDFGVKNIVAIMVVGFAGYSLMGEMKPISGKRKMKGGAGPAREKNMLPPDLYQIVRSAQETIARPKTRWNHKQFIFTLLFFCFLIGVGIYLSTTNLGLKTSIR